MQEQSDQISISQRLKIIRDEIAETCARSGRDPGHVRLVAVSKRKPAEAVHQASIQGQVIFGENRIQEAREKIPQVAAMNPDPAPSWHLIGPLQRNKVKYAVKLFDMVHSLDSVALAQELNKRWTRPDPLAVLLQVNIGAEAQKFGFDPDETAAALREIAELPHLAVHGLMAIPPRAPHPEATRPHFKALAALAAELDALKLPGVSMVELSMGMSSDYRVAIEEGATLVRVGSALFGPRE